ncbi:MAG: HEAT repeat domain-containing protein, partial [Candidatus Brocadiae bacterium]|nr:HEAT repeat domain-containing protein [Candidatus Brocadiia bacterium]
MVEETFKEQELPTGFSAEIRRLLDAAATRGEEHERAIERLAEIGVAAVGPLCEALSDARAPVRRAAARALCAIGDARALRPILRLLYVDEAWQAELFRSGRVLAVPGVRE